MDYPALELENKTTEEVTHNIKTLREWSAPYDLTMVRVDGQYHDLKQIERALQTGYRPDQVLYIIRKDRNESLKVPKSIGKESKLSRRERRFLDRQTKPKR